MPNPLTLVTSAFGARRRPSLPVAPPPEQGDVLYQGIPRMPALFGRQGGPRQRHDRDEGYPANVGSTLATWVAARADAMPFNTPCNSCCSRTAASSNRSTKTPR